MQSDIFAVDMKQLPPRAVPLVRSPFHEANPAFSPDGKWLAFTSNESGRFEVYLQRLEQGETLRVAGERLLVSKRGAVCLRWRRDGKEIFVLAGDGSVYGSRVDLTGAKPVFQSQERLFAIGADAIAAVHTLTGFDVSLDGTRFLIPSTIDAQPTPLTVRTNWESALR